MVLNNSIKIIAIMIITVISIIVTISYSFANHLLKERVENQFLSEASSRGNAIYLLLNAYLQQINSLNYYLMEDSQIKNIINENSIGKSSTNSSLQIKLNQSSMLKQKIERYNILNNLNIDNV